MPMTMTLDFDGVAVALTPLESRTVLHELDVIRRRLDDGMDASERLEELRRQVRNFVRAHVPRVRLEEIEVHIDQHVWRVTARRRSVSPS